MEEKADTPGATGAAPYRRLMAILFTDIEGYSAMMQRDEDEALRAVKRYRNVIDEVVPHHQGEVSQYYGDGCLCVFRSAIDAVQCARILQQTFLTDPAVPVRAGIHIGEVLFEEGRIFGDGVNVASRIESIGQPGAVLFSREVHDKVRNHREFDVRLVGSYAFKNIEQPLEVYALANPDVRFPNVRRITGKLSKSPRNKSKLIYGLSTAAAMLIFLALVFFIKPFQSGGQRAGVEHGVPELKRSIAVLPFSTIGEAGGTEFIGTGIAEDILTHLAKIGDLTVIARGSSMRYKDTDKSVRTIAGELGVSSILQGSVRQHGQRLRVSVQLVDPVTDSYLWTEEYNRDVEDILNVQRDIALAVTEALRLELSPALRHRIGRDVNVNPEAYVHYQRGQQIIKRSAGTSEELEQAVEQFKTAIAIDSNFSLAHIGLAEAYLEYIWWNRAINEEVFPSVRAAALRALALSPDIGEAYSVLGAIEQYQFNLTAAEQYFRKAIELSPNYAFTYERLAWVELIYGREENYFRLMEKVRQLDPLSTRLTGSLPFAYYAKGRFDEGIAHLMEYLKLFPDDNYVLWNIAFLHIGKGNCQEAIQYLERRTIGLKTNWLLGYCYAKSGRTSEAQSILDVNLERARSSYVPDYMIAVQYLGLGDRDKALEYLQRSFERSNERTFSFVVKNDPIWMEYRADSRFQQVLLRIEEVLKE